MNFRTLCFLALFLLAGQALQPQEKSTPSSASKPPEPTPPVQHETVVVTGTFTPVSETEIDRSVTVIETAEDLLHNNWVDYL